MKYLLDTNVCIRYINGRSSEIIRKLQYHDPEEIAVCSIVVQELRHGAMRSNNPGINIARHNRFLEPYYSYPFDDEAAIESGNIRAFLANQGMSIGLYDVMIGAIANVNGLTLVTHNVKEFGRIPNLKIDDWESA